MSQIECPDCFTLNNVDETNSTYAYECCACYTPHWLSNEHMDDYMRETETTMLEAEDDLVDRIPCFADSSIEMW